MRFAYVSSASLGDVYQILSTLSLLVDSWVLADGDLVLECYLGNVRRYLGFKRLLNVHFYHLIRPIVVLDGVLNRKAQIFQIEEVDVAFFVYHH